MSKLCNKCKVQKEDTEFYLVTRRGEKKLYHICKRCCSEVQKKFKSYYRDWELQKKYGITLEQYKQESENRNNCCDICSKQVKSLHVDHCHFTGKIRGFLCGSCNRGLGLFQESPNLLEEAYHYLKSKNE